MDKENGKGSEGSSGSSKLSNPADPAALLDAASLFGAYWPRGDANTANLFAAAAAGGYGLGPHGGMPFSMLPPTSGRGGVPAYPPASVASSAAAAYNNAYTNTLSVAASQAASLGIPAASAAWWSMASQLAAQDYLARLQASGLNFPGLNPADPYAALGLPSLPGAGGHHKSSKSKSLPKNSKDKNSSHSNSNSKHDAAKNNSNSKASNAKYSTASGLTIHPTSSASTMMANNVGGSHEKRRNNSHKSNNSANSLKSLVPPRTATSSIFTSPLSLASAAVSEADRHNSTNSSSTSTTQSLSATTPSLPPSILSAALEGNGDPNSILGGVRLPPDTEIIKYTSSIVGPKIPGTTNRGRKKTISLDPPHVSVHPTHSSTGMLIERSAKRQRLDSSGSDHNSTTSNSGINDRVEVIKLPATNGSPSTAGSGGGAYNHSYDGGGGGGGGEAPLNLSLKPTTSNHNSTRRKPGPKPRKVLQPSLPPGAPSASLVQLFASADVPRPSSRSDADTPLTTTGGTTISALPAPVNHKDARPRNLGRGVSKPKKNTVASLLAQSRALGIKPMPILDPNASMSQQMSLLKSNILAAQQYIAEVGGDEKTLNKFLQEKFRGALSDSSTVEASDSDNLTDSNQTDSEMEADFITKRQKQYDERMLKIPLEKGWKRETIIRGITKSGGIKGDVTYVAPESSNKFKQMSDVTQYLEYQKATDLTKENFTFSCRVILGDYLQAMPPEFGGDGEFIRMSEEDVSKRLEELKAAMRTSLPVEQRIEVARRQQAARAAARMDREQARIQREIERSERQEAARRDKEARTQQLLEGRKRLAFTLEQKVQIISEIEGGKSKSDVSRELGLASSTVATIWKNRDNIISAYGTEYFGRDSPNYFDKFAKADLTMSDCVHPAKRKRQEEQEKMKQEEQQRKQQERELKRQQAALLKEQMYIQEISKQRELLYTVELERERRRQHMTLIKSLESRRKLEERERKKQQALAEKQANKEKKMEQRRIELEILAELRKPCEDLELVDQVPMPEFPRITGLKLCGKAFGDALMVFEFLHNFGETLGFDMESLPTLDSLQTALLSGEGSQDAEEEMLSVMSHLIICAIEDPGIPNPARHTTILGQSLRQADITHANLSEILRIYLYANATGEVKALTGVAFERDREKRVADHHQNVCEMQQTVAGKNSHYYEQLHDNPTWKMSDMLKDKPFLALSPTDKAAILAFICNELLQNKAVIRQIETSMETVAQGRKDKWVIDAKVRKLRMLHNRKVRTEAIEKEVRCGLKPEGEAGANESGVMDSPALNSKDELGLDEEDNEMSENESLCTQPEEEEDSKLSGEELGKKLEKVLKHSEAQLQLINNASHQLRATCFGQDRFFRRYWTLPTAGGIFVEAMEAAEPEALEDIIAADKRYAEMGLRNIEDLKNVMKDVDDEEEDNTEADMEVSEIVSKQDETVDKEDTANEIIEDVDVDKQIDNNANEPLKPPKHMENGEVYDKVEHNLDELKKSVDKMVNDIEKTDQVDAKDNNKENKEIEVNKTENCITPTIKLEPDTDKKFNLFEKLGECMEREHTNDVSVKQEVKEELKQEILNELKTEVATDAVAEVPVPAREIKTENDEEKPLIESEQKWFSILAKDGSSCEGIHMTSGNRWDNGVGACTRDNITELKIPVFPPPNSNASYCSNSCDSPAPLQITPEESAQLEYIKKHGLPKPCERKIVSEDKRYGWWRITDVEQLYAVVDSLHARGAREKEFKRTLLTTMQTLYEQPGKMFIEEGNTDATELILDDDYEEVDFGESGAPRPDERGEWNEVVAQRVDIALLEQVEALEDKVANASMQQKGWKVPVRECTDADAWQSVAMAKERLASLEAAIERRYLKPPLGVNTGDPNLAAIAQEAGGAALPAQPIPAPDEIPKGLAVWREAVNRSGTSAQLAMCLYTLEASIAWDKSIMKAVSPSPVFNKQRARKYNSKLSNCQFCNSGDNEDKLLLCDSCDKGYHTYCFRPKLDTIPDGDWYCHECMNKATGEKNCIVCGKKQSATNTRLITCEVCPRGYHIDCMNPPMSKAPRGKWYCANCISKKPQKKAVKKPKPNRDSESSEHPPLSPAASHSSATTNEEIGALAAANHALAAVNHAPAASAAVVAAPPMPTQAAPAATSACDSAPQSPPPPHVHAAMPTTPPAAQSTSAARKEKLARKLAKELAPCKAILDDLEVHDDAWPFLLPVNTKQFPTYKKIIKSPMDLSTIRKRLLDLTYKSKEEFCIDVRQIFNNCETFNEDDSPVGKAGHCMRQFFEARWNELCLSHPHS
ncbi:bromodomain adjacent to zinc finger domain protein 2B isoform X6 [Atheta coriaria]|uniref:bromodomain adjacent to zinc finger domain protein 2B isoform X6 n=1 Tax=Dalotia coriaria TaxID=877792 RepID=UPI0031F3C0F9